MVVLSFTVLFYNYLMFTATFSVMAVSRLVEDIYSCQQESLSEFRVKILALGG